MTVVFILLTAVILDWLLGEPGRLHPLCGFGFLSRRLEKKLYGRPNISSAFCRFVGFLALVIMVTPFSLASLFLSELPFTFYFLLSVLVLYIALGHRSLYDHALPIVKAMSEGNESEARRLTGQIVSRDTDKLDINKAATESILENGNDAVFGALFWYLIAGIPGVLLYRMVNTLDAMWGYRNDRYRDFGWATARLDDMLNYLPARLTALTYALLGKTRLALRCWQQQASGCDSPNAGPVMSAGAGALGISLGGAACYQGEWHQRPVLGLGDEPNSKDIMRALSLVRNGMLLWIAIYITGVLLLEAI